jgi:DNA-directed RNA polymerase subunit RPC12/RpoP
MDCPYCGYSHVRRSRLRWSDFPEPIIGRLPMRCGDCSDRFFVWLPQVLISKLLGQLERENNAEWRKESSVVRHTDGHLFRTARARVTFSKMSVALAVQMKGLGF